MPAARPTMTAAQTEADKDRHVRQSELDDARKARQDEASQRLTAAQQARENQAAKDHEAAGLKKEAMQGMAQGYYDAASTNPGGTYFPPRYVNGIVVPGPATLMPSDKDQLADRQKALKSTAQGFEQTAKTHQAEQERIEKAHGWGKFAPPAQAPQAPAQPAAAQPVKNSQPVNNSSSRSPAGPQEGTVIVNPQTKERRVLKGGQWVPAP